MAVRSKDYGGGSTSVAQQLSEKETHSLRDAAEYAAATHAVIYSPDASFQQLVQVTRVKGE